MEVKVSVIVPIHNVSKYLEKCLKTLQNQDNFQDFEVLMMLDNPTNEDEEIADLFLADKRFKKKVVDFKDQGLVRNYGVKEALGEYVCFVDGDDYVENKFLFNLYSRAKETNADIVVSNYYLEKKGRKIKAFIKIKDWWNFKDNLIYAKKIVGDIRIRGYTWNKIYRREFLIENNINSVPVKNFVEDVCFNYLCFLKAKKIAFTSTYNYVYVFRENSSLHFDPFTFTKKYLNTLALLRFYSVENSIKETTNIWFFTKKIMLLVHGLQNLKYLKESYFKYAARVIKEINKINKCDLNKYLTNDEFRSAYNSFDLDVGGLKKRIFWFLEQLEFLGGTETATISIANLLSEYYNLTFVVTGNEIENLKYNISKNIKIIYLNNNLNTKVDEKMLKARKNKKYLKAIGIALRYFYFTILGKFKYRKQVLKNTNLYDILIASSPDNYQIMPRKRRFIFHYHFNSKYFLSFTERSLSHTYHKPNYYVFLSKLIRDDIGLKLPKILQNSTFIENMIKLQPHYYDEYFGNKFVFVGRYADQKNPLFLIEVAKILKDKGLDFRFDFYGSGKLKKYLENNVKKYNLSNLVFINNEEKDVVKIFSNKDLLLMSSNFEGMPLVINEANSQSVPVITTNFGDSTYDAVPENCGIIVENRDPETYANKLIELINNKERLKEYKKNAYNNAMKYSKDVILKKWLEFLDFYQKNINC